MQLVSPQRHAAVPVQFLRPSQAHGAHHSPSPLGHGAMPQAGASPQPVPLRGHSSQAPANLHVVYGPLLGRSGAGQASQLLHAVTTPTRGGNDNPHHRDASSGSIVTRSADQRSPSPRLPAAVISVVAGSQRAECRSPVSGPAKVLHTQQQPGGSSVTYLQRPRESSRSQRTEGSWATMEGHRYADILATSPTGSSLDVTAVQESSRRSEEAAADMTSRSDDQLRPMERVSLQRGTSQKAVKSPRASADLLAQPSPLPSVASNETAAAPLLASATAAGSAALAGAKAAHPANDEGALLVQNEASFESLAGAAEVLASSVNDSEERATEDMGWTPSFHSLAPLEDDDQGQSMASLSARNSSAAILEADLVGPGTAAPAEDVNLEKHAAAPSHQDIQAAEKMVSDLKAAIALKAAERRRLESQANQYAESIADSDATVARLAGDLEDTKNQRDALRKQLKEKSERHADLTARLQSQQEANAELEGDLAKIVARRQQLENQAKHEHNLRVQAESFAKELQRKLQQIRDDMAAVGADRSSVKTDTCANLETHLDRLRQQLEETVRAVQTNRLASNTAPTPPSAAAASPVKSSRRRRPSVGSPSPASSPPRKNSSICVDSSPPERPKAAGAARTDTGVVASTTQRLAGLDVEAVTSSQPAGGDDATEDELPTAQQHLLGQWSTPCLQALDNSGLSDATAAASGAVVDSRVAADTPSANPSPSKGNDVTDQSNVVPNSPSRRESEVGRTSSLSMRDLCEIKALKKPPPPIRMLMEVCCLLFNIQPVKQPDDKHRQLWRYDYWEPARRYLLSDPFFLSKLRTHDEEISSTQRAKIRKYFQDPEFTAERVKTCSRAAHELYCWLSLLIQKQPQSQPLQEDIAVGVGASPRRARSPSAADRSSPHASSSFTSSPQSPQPHSTPL